MLDAKPSSYSAPRAKFRRLPEFPLIQWLRQTLPLPGVRLKMRLRGNNLHVLCEATRCPSASQVVRLMVQALAVTDLDALTPADQPPIYQVLLYGRASGQTQAAWTEMIYLGQLEKYLEQLDHLEQAEETDTPVLLDVSLTAPVTSSALVVSNRSLARQGRPDAIARYLSETLSTLGLGVEVTAKSTQWETGGATEAVQANPGNAERTQRLLIYCQSAYSPDPAAIADSISRQLRELELPDFRDALLLSQVSGESQPDWILRIDLTPPEEILREAARWGDVEAIGQLLNQSLAVYHIHLSALLKESTLYLFCRATQFAETEDAGGVGSSESLPSKREIVHHIATLLESLAPQGIRAATIYGLSTDPDDPEAYHLREAPVWVDWLHLPASVHPALSDTTLTLAQQGDQPAIAFLLSRMLNPDLTEQLATGGIRVQILRKGDLLHVMTDAPVCPRQKQVGHPVAQFLRQLRLPSIAGVRVYGRRSGQKRPLWCYGMDFVPRHRFVPEAAPEFAASDAYVGDLVATADEPILQATLTAAELQETLTAWGQECLQSIQQGLIRLQLFVPREGSHSYSHFASARSQYSLQTALVWSTLGVLLTLQTDWILGQVLHNRLASQSGPVETVRTELASANAAEPQGAIGYPSPFPGEASNVVLRHQGGDGHESSDAAFNASGFTESTEMGDPSSRSNGVLPTESIETESGEQLLASPLKDTQQTVAILDAAPPDYPTFNAQQLDEKLALYRYHLQTEGTPDVMIIGSSRALRGVDPAALQQFLKDQGYPNLRIFNFGVNGATAQVVDLILRQILLPEQLPKLIIWADGSRAFNSGRVDVTYNAIAASEGYAQLRAGTLPPLMVVKQAIDADSATTEQENEEKFVETIPSLASSYQDVNTWLNDRLAKISAAYDQRAMLKTVLRSHLTQVDSKAALAAKLGTLLPPPSQEGADMDAFVRQVNVDLDGFLPLSVRFNPATYFQQYSRVSGDYDGDYANFTLEGKQIEALDQLLAYTKAQDVTLMFINLPLSAEYLDPLRLEHEVEFQKFLVEQSQEKNWLTRDWSELWPYADDYFSDPSHLNRYGAYSVSERLIQDPIIPWPSPAKN